MEHDNWEKVLVQWINCLKLTKPIDDITHLRNNEFFSNFFLILLSKEDKTDGVLNLMYDVLQDTYPNFKFPLHEERASLERSDLTEICSLCLHYACVIAKNNTLIAPLCQGLQHTTQLSIRTFLETLTTNVTPETLRLVVSESVKEGTPGVLGVAWPAMGDSPLTCRGSPLQEMFKTPLSKSKFIEKDREVKKLRLELETERYDKADIQEELREHKEKIKKIDLKLKEKCAEISKLRSELYQRDCGDPEEYKDRRDNREVENRLKAEICSLEKYIKESEIEQQKLQDINFKTTEKLKLSNEETQLWQEKAITLEVTHADLIEKYSLKSMELENLKTQCAELSTIIEGLRPTNDSFNVSLLTTPLKRRSFTNSASQSVEDLAHSIIDVQLKDAQKENGELREMLEESRLHSKTLDDELTQVKRSYDTVSEELSRVQSGNDELLTQIDVLSSQHRNIEDLLEKSQREISELLKNVNEKESMILFLRESYEETTRLNKEFQATNDELKLKTTVLEMELNANKMIVEQKDNICESLRKESANLEEKYARSVNEYEIVSSDFGVLRKNYDTVLKSFEESCKRLSGIVNQDGDYNAAIDKIIMERSQDKKTIEKLGLSLGESEDLIIDLQERNRILEDKFNVTKIEKEHFETILEDFREQIAKLETEIDGKTEEINDVSFRLIELNETISKLQSSSPPLRKNNNLRDFIDFMISDVKQAKQNINEEISNKNKEIDDLNATTKKNIEEFMKINEKLTLENLEKDKTYLEKMLVLEAQIKDVSENLRYVETSLDLSEKNLHSKTAEIKELLIGKQTLQENFDRVKIDLESKLAVTLDTNRKLEMETQIIRNEKSNLESNVEKFSWELEKLAEKRDELTRCNQELKTQFLDCSNTLRKKEKTIEDQDMVISKTNKELLCLKLELEAVRQNYRDLQLEIDKLKQEECKYKFCIETLERTNTEFEVKLAELAQQKTVLNDLKNNIERKNEDLHRNMSAVLEQLSRKNEELDFCRSELIDFKNLAELETNELRNQLTECGDKLGILIKERNDTEQTYNKEISQLKKDLQESRNTVYELNAKEVSSLQEIEMLKSELNLSFEKYAENFNVQQETKLELENQVKALTENVYAVVTQCNKLEETNRANLAKLSALNIELNELKSEKITLEVRLVNQQKKYEIESQTTREQFLLDINNLSTKEKKLELSLDKALNDLESGRGIQYRLENEVKKLSTKLQNIQQEKEYLQDRSQLLENTKKEVEIEYNKLKLTHEKYIIETEHNLKTREEKLNLDLCELKNENDKFVSDFVDLQQTLEFLKREKEIAMEEHSKTVENLQVEIDGLNVKINNLEVMNATISREQELLRKNTRAMQLEIEKRLEENAKQVDVISKLQCACDILQTGKDRVEIDLRTVRDAKRKVEEELQREKTISNEKFKKNNEESAMMQQELETKLLKMDDLERRLSEKKIELNELREVYEKVHLEKASSEEELKKSRELHKEFLMQIDEENLTTIGDMTFDFLELKTSYERVCHQIKTLRKDKKKLESIIKDGKTMTKNLEETIQEKIDLLKTEEEKFGNLQEVFDHKQKQMEEIAGDLQKTLEDLERVKADKYEAEIQLKLVTEQLRQMKIDYEEIVKVKDEILAEKQDEFDRNHRNATELLTKIKTDFATLKNNKDEIEEVLRNEKESKAFLEVKLLTLVQEKTKYEQILAILIDNINKFSNTLIEKPIVDNFNNLNEDDVKIIKEEIEARIAEVYNRINQLNNLIETLQTEKTEIEVKLLVLSTEKDAFISDKTKLFSDYDSLNKEYEAQREKYTKEKEILTEELETKNQKINKELENLKNENDILHQTVSSLKQNNIRAYEDYQRFLEVSRTNKLAVEKLLRDRNATETVLNELKQKLTSVQMKYVHLPQDFSYKKYFDQKESLEVIIEDLSKQFHRYSRISFNITWNFGLISEKIMQAIISEKNVETEAIFKDLEIDETQEKIVEIKDHAMNALEQLTTLERTLETVEVKSSAKILKENNARSNLDCKTDEELRKKYISLKQKLTITENVKNNYEKKLKQLRDENKKLTANNDTDTHYKTLLAQHVDTKETLEKKINDLNVQLTEKQSLKAPEQPDDVNKEFEDVKKELADVKTELVDVKKELDIAKKELDVTNKEFDELKSTHTSSEQKIIKLQSFKQNQIAQKEKDGRDTEALRVAYGKLMSDNSKLTSEIENLKKLLQDKCAMLNEYSQIKEAYEKLLEENNAMMTEIDTLKFKRNKDKEEYVRLLKKEREEHSVKETKTVAEIRAEYEHKLEAVRKKMINLYKSEVDKEMRKVLVEKEDNAVLLGNLKRCKTELEESKLTIEQLRRANLAERRRNELTMSRESVGSRSVRSENDFSEVVRIREVVDCPRSHKRSSVHPVRTVVDTRKCATLPRNMDIIEEVNIRRRMSSVNPSDLAYRHDDMEMEDEGELFNNKYLADLKEGRCAAPSDGRESTSSRMSELAWRNSLVPPHLKSSYPAEVQMVTPSKFTEDDIKAGAVDLDDSMNTKLLPADKTRNKKDAGTTSYKRPGPPTPSKNGGRQSLAGTESREVLREQNDSSQPKRSTPNRIGAFFLGRKSFGQSTGSNAENQPPESSPKNKSAVKLFRKGR